MKSLIVTSITLFLSVLAFWSFSQPVTPKDYGLKSFKIEDKDLGPIGFHIDTINIEKRSPLIVYINGSGGYPLIFYVESDSSSSVVTTFDHYLLQKASNNFHVVLIDKPGLAFCDTIAAQSDRVIAMLENYQAPREYTNRLDLRWRVKSASAVISFLLNKFRWKNIDIIAWGFSEGGQVVPRLAADDKRITHVVAVAGSGLNQFYDNIFSIRMRVASGALSHEKAQKQIQELYNTYKDIYANKTATDKEYEGHSYKRWASFTLDDKIVAFAKLNIPIYLLAASADENSPILGLEYVPLEFLRLGKTNLTYEVCVGCNHYFEVVSSEDSSRIGKDLSKEYVNKILEWIDHN